MKYHSIKSTWSHDGIILINIFDAKYLKKTIPRCLACFKDSWILRVYGFNTEYLQNHLSYCCETEYIKVLF